MFATLVSNSFKLPQHTVEAYSTLISTLMQTYSTFKDLFSRFCLFLLCADRRGGYSVCGMQSVAALLRLYTVSRFYLIKQKNVVDWSVKGCEQRFQIPRCGPEFMHFTWETFLSFVCNVRNTTLRKAALLRRAVARSTKVNITQIFFGMYWYVLISTALFIMKWLN